MDSINWEATSAIAGGILTAIVFHAWCMKKIINEALNDFKIIALKEFATKDELKEHIEHCPYQNNRK